MFWWWTASHWAILAQAIPTGHMWPPAATATIDGVVQVYSVPSQVWDAFCSAVGDPGSDLRILASLPASMVSEAATLCRLGMAGVLLQWKQHRWGWCTVPDIKWCT